MFASYEKNQFRIMLRIIVILCVLSGRYALSQDASSSEESEVDGQSDNGKDLTLDDLYIDFAIPDLSAFALLGIDQNKISRPGNPKELAVAFQNMAGRQGTIGSGVAFEWGPANTFLKNLTQNRIDRYRKYQFVNNLLLSTATVKEEEGEATSLAVGLRWLPIDRSDPLVSDKLRKQSGLWLKAVVGSLAEEQYKFMGKLRMFLEEVYSQSYEYEIFSDFQDVFNDEVFDWQSDNVEDKVNEVMDKLEKVIKKYEEKAKFSDAQKLELKENYVEISVLTVADKTERETYIEKEIKKAKMEFKRGAWNSLVLNIAVGTICHSDDSSWKELKPSKFSLFAGLAFPVLDKTLNDSIQGIIQGQYARSFDNEAEEHWNFSVGGRLLYLLGNSNHRLSGEMLYSQFKHEDPAKDGKSLRATLGIEFRIFDGTWLEVAAGGNWPLWANEEARSEILWLVNIKYALQKERRFKIE